MKLFACILILVCIAGVVPAQERNRYGVVGVAAIIPTPDGKDETVRLANELLDALRKDAVVTTRGEIQMIGEPTEARISEIATRLALEWLALVHVDPRDQRRGLFTVEVVHVIRQKIATRTVALFGFIRTAQDAVAADIKAAANHCSNAVAALVTGAKRIWVVLTLLTDPPEADYVFGGSSNRTNKDGWGRWEGTLPPGPTQLRVLRQPDYKEKAVEIVIPSVECSPCYLPYQKLHLTKLP